MPKLTTAERTQIEGIVANLYIKQIPDSLVIDEIRRQIGKTVSRITLYHTRQRIKKEGYKWYQQLRKDDRTCDLLLKNWRTPFRLP